MSVHVETPPKARGGLGSATGSNGGARARRPAVPPSKAVLRYEVHAETTGPGTSAATTRQAELSFDSSAGLSQSLFGPADLLAAALAACLLKNVERFSGILPFRYRGARVGVVAEREDSPPRIARLGYRLDIETDEPRHRVDLLHRNIAKFGTIYNTLAPTCEISGEIVAHPTYEQDETPPGETERG